MKTVYYETYNNLAVKESDFFCDTEIQRKSSKADDDIIYVASQFINDREAPFMIERAKELYGELKRESTDVVPYFPFPSFLESSWWYVFAFPNGVKRDEENREFQRFTVIRTNSNSFPDCQHYGVPDPNKSNLICSNLNKSVKWEFIGRFYVEIESKKMNN